MDFSLSQEQVLQQNLFRSIAEKEIKPIARDMDEDEVYSPKLLALLQSSGLLGIPFSRR